MFETDTNPRLIGVVSPCKAARNFCKDSTEIPARICQYPTASGVSQKHRLVGYDPLSTSGIAKPAISAALPNGLVKGKHLSCKAYAGFGPARILAGGGAA
jgi:hypothetical protein